MDVSVIGIVGLPANYGGFETLTENLASDPRLKLTVYCSSNSYEHKVKTYKNAELVYIPLKANGIQSILYDQICILHSALKGQKKILVLGVSGAVIFPFIRLFFPSIRIITNIDGIEWQREKWNKLAKSFLKFSEKIAIRYSNIVISDNDAIRDYITTKHKAHSEVIAYGGDQHISKKGELESDTQNLEHDYALSICRIEPENNVDLILNAFSEAKTLKIKFVGNWNVSEYASKLKIKFQDDPFIEIIDAVYDAKVIHNLRKDCFVYIHGHSAGGTNPSLVEIMHYDKTVIAFECMYNISTMRNKGLFFDNKNSLIATLQTLPQTNMKKIGIELGNIARESYTWKTVCDKYYSLLKKQ